MRQAMLNVCVDDFTTPSPVSVTKQTPVKVVIELMDSHGIRHMPVVEDGCPVGIISDRDLRVALTLPEGQGLAAEKVMTSEPYTVSPEASLDEVAFAMSKNKYGSAIVQNIEGEVVGIFTNTDALNALIEIIRGQAG